MSTIVLENIRGADLPGELNQLNPDERYFISIQPIKDRQAIINELIAASKQHPVSKAIAAMTEDEIMEMVNQEIDADHQESAKI